MAAGPWLTWSHHRLEADSDIVTAGSPQSWVLGPGEAGPGEAGPGVRLVVCGVGLCLRSCLAGQPLTLTPSPLVAVAAGPDGWLVSPSFSARLSTHQQHHQSGTVREVNTSTISNNY